MNINNQIQQKDIEGEFSLKVLAPEIVLLQLVLNDAHTEGAYLEVLDDGVELSETREAEEDVDNVRRQLRTLLPVVVENTRQCAYDRFYEIQK